MNFLCSFYKLNKHNRSVTFQEVLYVKELLNELETMQNHEMEKNIFTSLDKVLIYMNFNSEPYINYITQKIAWNMNVLESIRDKIDYLQFHLKDFNQLQRKSGLALCFQQADLKNELNNWFKHEIFYLEKKVHLSTVPSKTTIEKPIQKRLIENAISKVRCIFSTDQMGIILRAFDELKVVEARSMNEFFKTIVPHLSTRYKEELSYDAMRSKSYVTEERDKKIVIDTLLQIIGTIKRY